MGSLEWGSGANTLCEKFNEDVTGCGWQGTSALDAWNRNAVRQHLRTRDYEIGDSVYFGGAAENGGFGHVGIVTGPDEFTSVTDYGVKTFPISTWIAPYLGWVRYWT